MQAILRKIRAAKRSGKTLFAVLIDPDKFNPAVINYASRGKADLILVGGSGLKKNNFESCIHSIRKSCRIPLVIFPGSREQVSSRADALLLLSLISGRNPDYLIGEHIRVADKLRRSSLEIIPTGYILIGTGSRKSSTQKVSKTTPIKADRRSLIRSTAVAAELLGMQLVYLEAGSGNKTLSPALTRMVARSITVPVVAGGGIDSAQKALKLARSGVSVIVAGNAIERNPKLAEIIPAVLQQENKR